VNDWSLLPLPEPRFKEPGGWLSAYLRFTDSSEAPDYMRLWCGIGAVSACLERKVWFDQIRFKYYPNHYIVLVGPPGLSKTTCILNALELVEKVPRDQVPYPPGEGPTNTTWQALFHRFEKVARTVEIPGLDPMPMSAMTLKISDISSFLNTENVELVGFLTDVWDCPSKWDKDTRKDGQKIVEGVWINILAGATPSWIAQSFNQNTMDGGFSTRCIFVYAAGKVKKVAFVEDEIADRKKYDNLKEDLIADLVRICRIMGEYKLTPEAKAWAKDWYDNVLWGGKEPNESTYLGVYKARKQAHSMKVAMCIAAAQRNERIITIDDVKMAVSYLDHIEPEMLKVFSRIGEHSLSRLQGEVVALIARRKEMSLAEVTRYIMRHIPDHNQLVGFLQVLKESGLVRMETNSATGRVKFLWVETTE